jgi:hypothetical protein
LLKQEVRIQKRELQNSQRARKVRSGSFIAEMRRTQAKNGYGEWGGGLIFRQVQRARRTKQVRQIRNGLPAGGKTTGCT